MPHPLNIQNLSFSYPNSSALILKNINLEFNIGWSAIIGANGCGKSTLLKLIAKELVADEGTIKGNELVHLCVQNTEIEPIGFSDFMTTYNSKAFKIRNSLEIKDEWLGIWKLLSHGQRKRVQIAIALFVEPDILILDEPTNHLDGKSKKIVYEALKNFNGIGILVSHDRVLLDKLCKNTVILKNAQAIIFKVNYSTAMHEYTQGYEHLRNVQNQRDEEIKKLKKIINLQQEKVQKSKQRLSKKGLNANDSDAKEKINLAKLTGKDKNDGQILKRLLTKHRHLKEKSIVLDKNYRLGISFEVQGAKKLFPIFIQQGILSIYEKQKVLFSNMRIEECDKIGVVGENGSGKSSFIDYLLKIIDQKENVFYIPQEITKEQGEKLLSEINNISKEKKGEIYTMITRLSSDPKILIESCSPSPGEIRKLLLAKALLAKPSLIILDEPTNHMDINSITALENALKEYKGTLILVSHDEIFLQNTTKKIWSFEELNSEVYEIKEQIL